jgi:hypothetical protein
MRGRLTASGGVTIARRMTVSIVASLPGSDGAPAVGYRAIPLDDCPVPARALSLDLVPAASAPYWLSKWRIGAAPVLLFASEILKILNVSDTQAPIPPTAL